MYYHKLTKAEKSDAISKLQRRRQLLQENKTILAWKEFLKMPYQEQQRRREAWNKYFEEVRHSVAYAVFQEQTKASKVGNWGRVKELAAEMKKMREDGAVPSIPKPTFTDPFEFFSPVSIVREYQKIEAEIKEMTNYPEIYKTEGQNEFSE